MDITIGINANHADSAIAVFEKNKLIFGIEEERINRIKHWAGVPIDSIKYALNYCDIKPEEITNITFNTNPLSNLSKKLPFFFLNYLFSKKGNEIIKRQSLKLEIKKKIISITGNKNIKFNYIDHHLSHIASAYFPSKFNDAIGLSIDGFGDFCSCVITLCKNNNIKVVDKIYFPHSIGVFYEAFTQLIGFKNYGDEYKMMGLSCYGKPVFKNKIIENLFIKKNTSLLNLNFFNHNKRNFEYSFCGLPKQKDLLNEKILKVLNINTKDIINNHNLRIDLAASAQSIFEDHLIKIIKKITEKYNIKNLVYAGGCALNSLANKNLYDYFDNVFIPYAPGDAGGSIGSAMLFLSKKYKNFENIKNPYIGPSFSNREIEENISKFNFSKKVNIFKIENENEYLDKIANHLISNKVVGFFNDRMEFGARALGNRSILASPISANMKDIINKKIKKRESFRPFAPAILEEEKIKWFEKSKTNPYMSNVELIKSDKRDQIPAVTHFDGTGRVQTVNIKSNPLFYKLIKNFFEKTNVPVLLNTSFNENEPIVLKPLEALKCFNRTDIDILVLGHFIIERK